MLIEKMYEQTTRAEAEEVWDEWQRELPPNNKTRYKKWCEEHGWPLECFDAFRSFTHSGFLYYKPYILNYFNPGCRYTNGTTEALNRQIKKLYSSGNGLKFKHLRAKVLYASLIYKRTIYSVDIKTISSWKPTYTYTHGVGTKAAVEETKTYKISIKPKTVDIPESLAFDSFDDSYEECETIPIVEIEGEFEPYDYNNSNETLMDLIDG